jgi:hypothetical protein
MNENTQAEPTVRPDVTGDKLSQLKHDLATELSKNYGLLVDFLKKLPNSPMKDHGILNFDQGFLWIREMILTQLQLSPEPTGSNLSNSTPASSAPPAPPV